MKQIFLLLSILLLLLTVCACGISHYSKTGDLDGVKGYVEKGEIERTNEHGFTPLMIATYYGHTQLVKYLVENGADVNAQDNSGWTPLRYAYYYNYKEIAEILLKYNAVVSPVKEDPIKNNNAVVFAFDQAEPWTGKWKVEGDLYGGIWGMKQSGKIVNSTKDSFFEFKGNVMEDRLKGRMINSGLVFPFVIKISLDGMSFEGNMKGVEVNHFLKGTRME